jgi:hypothetical protein
MESQSSVHLHREALSGNIFKDHNVQFGEIVCCHLEVLELMIAGEDLKKYLVKFKTMVQDLKLSSLLEERLVQAVEIRDVDFLKVFRLCLYSREILGIYASRFGRYVVENDVYCKVIYGISLYANQHQAKYRVISEGMFYGQGKYDASYFNEGIQYMEKRYDVDPVVYKKDILDLTYEEDSESEMIDEYTGSGDAEYVMMMEEEVATQEMMCFVSEVKDTLEGKLKQFTSGYEYEFPTADYSQLLEYYKGNEQFEKGKKKFAGLRIEKQVEISAPDKTCVGGVFEVERQGQITLMSQVGYLSGEKYVEKSYVAGSGVHYMEEGKVVQSQPPELVKILVENPLVSFSCKTVVYARYVGKVKKMSSFNLLRYGQETQRGQNYKDMCSRKIGEEYVFRLSKNFFKVMVNTQAGTIFDRVMSTAYMAVEGKWVLHRPRLKVRELQLFMVPYRYDG